MVGIQFLKEGTVIIISCNPPFKGHSQFTTTLFKPVYATYKCLILTIFYIYNKKSAKKHCYRKPQLKIWNGYLNPLLNGELVEI